MNVIACKRVYSASNVASLAIHHDHLIWRLFPTVALDRCRGRREYSHRGHPRHRLGAQGQQLLPGGTVRGAALNCRQSGESGVLQPYADHNPSPGYHYLRYHRHHRDSASDRLVNEIVAESTRIASYDETYDDLSLKRGR